jgi:Uma2 family endonuclease
MTSKKNFTPTSVPTGQYRVPKNYYYELHPTKKDLIPQSYVHSRLIHYLMNVLDCNFTVKGWFILKNIGIYQTANPKEYPLAPDITLVQGAQLSAEEKNRLRSWRLLEPNRPVPKVVIELSSKNWKEDVLPDKKPKLYRELKVTEYFAYDPNTPPLWREKRKPPKTRLKGWRYNKNGTEEIPPDERGWLQSKTLGIWLAPEEEFLRLYSLKGDLLLTGAEAQSKARLEAEQKALQKQSELENLLEKLRQKGINPDQL